jgi:hypothetical protein
VLNRIKPKDIKPLREQMLVKQGGRCALCQEVISPTEAVLDHDHKSGLIRAVLHRGCNTYIGALENNLARNRITPSRLEQILNNFWTYTQTLTDQYHPSHRTPEEKKLRAKTRAKKRRQNK